jgi:hypothetical protein
MKQKKRVFVSWMVSGHQVPPRLSCPRGGWPTTCHRCCPQLSAKALLAQTTHLLPAGAEQPACPVLVTASADPERVASMTWCLGRPSRISDRLRQLGEAYRACMGTCFLATSGIEVSTPIEERTKEAVEVTEVPPNAQEHQQKSPHFCELFCQAESLLFWLRRQDLNLRPLGYEPNELPGCSTPRQALYSITLLRRLRQVPHHRRAAPVPPAPWGRCRPHGNPFSRCGCSHLDGRENAGQVR